MARCCVGRSVAEEHDKVNKLNGFRHQETAFLETVNSEPSFRFEGKMERRNGDL